VNGPPFPTNPILFAGTWKQYSKKAIPQLIIIIENSPNLLNAGISANLRCPYHAKVMKVLDKTNNRIVYVVFIFHLSKFFNVAKIAFVR
jgi:hypothetical protein